MLKLLLVLERPRSLSKLAEWWGVDHVGRAFLSPEDRSRGIRELSMGSAFIGIFFRQSCWQ